MKKIIALLLVFVSIVTVSSCAKSEEWPTTGLSQVIPVPEKGSFHIITDDEDDFRVDVKGFSKDECNSYIEKCKEAGFVEDENADSAYDNCLFNKDGYKLEIHYFDSNKEMDIIVTAPKKMKELRWPDGKAGQIVPRPTSEKGSMEWEYEDSFCLYVGDMDYSSFNDYIKVCSDAGFNVNYERGDSYYYAKNEEGYSLDLKYEGYNTILVRLEKPKEEESETITETESETIAQTESEDSIETDPAPETQTPPETEETNVPVTEEETKDSISIGKLNALGTAKTYLDIMAFSYNGLIEQLEFEKYTHEEAVYAADNCGADWNEQAAKKAKDYLDIYSFSRDGLIEQLEYEGFTYDQAVYGVEANGY